MLLSTLATTLGLHRGRSSQMMSPPDRSPASRRVSKPRKAGSTRSMESLTETAELALPGLEKASMTESSPGHWIERGPQKRLMVFAGRSHPDLAGAIAEHLGLELGGVELETFKNDETYCRYKESIRGADVFLVQTGSIPVDRNLMELMLMIQAAKLASAKRITARVKDKIAIVGDDVIMTGGTLIANVHALREKDVKGVWVFATHGVFCGGALEKFHEAPIDGIVVTDTVPIDLLAKPPNMTILPVAQLLAETIMNVFEE